MYYFIHLLYLLNWRTLIHQQKTSMRFNPFYVFIPPFKLHQMLYFGIAIPISYNFGRNTCYNGIRRDILCNNTTHCNDSTVSDFTPPLINTLEPIQTSLPIIHLYPSINKYSLNRFSSTNVSTACFNVLKKQEKWKWIPLLDACKTLHKHHAIYSKTHQYDTSSNSKMLRYMYTFRHMNRIPKLSVLLYCILQKSISIKQCSWINEYFFSSIFTQHTKTIQQTQSTFYHIDIFLDELTQ